MIVALAQINPTIGALEQNCAKIIKAIGRAKEQGAQLVVFPEMAICGYPPEDLLLLPSFLEAIQKAEHQLLAATKGIAVVVGTIRFNLFGGEKALCNSALLINDGEIIGYQDKTLLPDYDVFSERRYFEPARSSHVWSIAGKRIALTICEDLWQHACAVEYTSYQCDPVAALVEQSPDLLLNLSASPFYQQRQQVRLDVSSKAAKTLGCPVLLCNQVGGNDGLIFDGSSLCVGADGCLRSHAKAFVEDLLFFNLEEPGEAIEWTPKPVEDLHSALVLGIRDYFHKQGFTKACFGLSGGIDSAVVACLAAEALGKENILALTLPSRFSSKGSVEDSKLLANTLGIECKELSIEQPFEAFEAMLAPHFIGQKPDVTEENLQARIRGVLLMAFSNKFGYLLLGTGNKSEMAMGYATLYGDMCGGLGVLSDVSKGQVYALARLINQEKAVIPQVILDKPPSAELRLDQKDSDSLPDYAILDHVLADYVEEHLSPEEIASRHQFDLSCVKELVRKIHLNEYKRQQAPPGLRVTKRAFTTGRRFPIVQKWNV